jgi:hypothetical protein
MIRLLIQRMRCDAMTTIRRWYIVLLCVAANFLAFSWNAGLGDADEKSGNDTALSAVKNDPAPKDDSRIIRARFSDGTVLLGELLLDDLEIETAFGKLVVPRTQLLGFSPGLDSRGRFDDRLDEWITALTSTDQANAAAAERELMRLGPAVVDELGRRAKELEGDAAKRLSALADRLREASSEVWLDDRSTRPLIRKDRIRTTSFTIVGRIVPQSLRFESKYGQLEVALGDIVGVERPSENELDDVAKTLSVTGQNITLMKKTGVSVRKGDRIIVKASGMIKRTAATSTYVSSPDGSSRFGTHPTDPQIQGGTLIAKIGNRDKVIKVGSNAAFVAENDGVLSFGIAMRQNYVGRYQFPGEYKVQLRVERGD